MVIAILYEKLPHEKFFLLSFYPFFISFWQKRGSDKMGLRKFLKRRLKF
jgi:hypothetical protein